MWQPLHRLVFAFALLGVTGTAQAEGFLVCVDDLPLAPGLTEVEDSCLNFDTAEGRVALAEARGDLSVTEVLEFYRSVLPAFGWTLQGSDVFAAVRAGERLQISVDVTDSGDVRVLYALAPSPGA